ncbi:GntR family transcriptional regulator [Streptomyces sp. SID10815]|uniref:GntR family transcriptional regulator n=1 Tax=Streptomyces sp. SID10815 TaxID=2706027 RepID=UPI0013CCDA6B|nr:GntR family transcriptional regulator [Streptomyces sp. SID10815]NEA52384.1 GntR family transcriptional regulator [Streptomyces sp. SID10815]
MPDSPERTALYRYFDAVNDLLYIGISADPDERWKVHKWGPNRMSWIRQVTRHVVQWHESRSAALKAEEEAIRSERPRYNGTHNHPLAPFNPAAWPRVVGRRGKADALAVLICQEIDSGRWVAGMMIPRCGDLAKATGISPTTATMAIRTLQQQGRLKRIHGVGVFVYDGTSIKRPNHPHLAQ